MLELNQNKDGFLPAIVIVGIALLIGIVIMAAFWPNILIGLVLIGLGGFLALRQVIPGKIGFIIAIALILFGALLILYPGAVGLYIGGGI